MANPRAQRWFGVLIAGVYYGIVLLALMAGWVGIDIRYDYGIRHEALPPSRLSLIYASFLAFGLLPGMVLLAIGRPGRSLTTLLFAVALVGVGVGATQPDFYLLVGLPYLILSGWMGYRWLRAGSATKPAAPDATSR